MTDFASFYAVMPPDNPVAITPGSDIEFPNDGISSSTTITLLTSSTFNLSEIGVYEINYQVSISESAQLVLALNGVELLNTVVGRFTGSSQIVGLSIINTTVVNSVLSVRNPSVNFGSLNITPNSGGVSAVTANINIFQLL